MQLVPDWTTFSCTTHAAGKLLDIIFLYHTCSWYLTEQHVAVPHMRPVPNWTTYLPQLN